MRKKNLPITQESTAAAEIDGLGRKLALALEGYARYNEGISKLQRADAEDRARGVAQNVVAQAVDGDATALSWISLSVLAEANPEAWEIAWKRIRESARQEIISGFRASKTLGPLYDASPIDRGRFLAVRDALIKEWTPLEGAELTLVDMLAQIQIVWESWLSRHLEELSLGFTSESVLRRAENVDVKYSIPRRLSEAQALEQSAMMMERFQRMYLRNVRALRELKKSPMSVTVGRADQVFLAEKQINIQEHKKPARKAKRARPENY